MLSSSRNSQEDVIREAADILKKEGYEVARDISVRSGHGGIVTRVDLMGKSPYGVIVVEAKSATTSGAELSPFWQAAVTLTQQPTTPTSVVLVTGVAPSDTLKETARQIKVNIIVKKDLKDQLHQIVEHQRKGEQSD